MGQLLVIGRSGSHLLLQTSQQLAPKLESFFEGYGLKLRMKDPTRESYAVYDEDQSCSDVMPELIAALSELTGDYAVGSVCMDSDFAALVLAKAGKQCYPETFPYFIFLSYKNFY